MRIRIQYFGPAQDLAGVSSEEIDLPVGSTVDDAAGAATIRHPDLSKLLSAGVRFARNTDYAKGTAPLEDGDTVSWIPPVGGG